MNEFTLNGLINLFSLFSVISQDIEESRKRVESFLIFHAGRKSAAELLELFDELADFYRTEKFDDEAIISFAGQSAAQLQPKLNHREQTLLYLRLLELIASVNNELAEKLINIIRQNFNIDSELNAELRFFAAYSGSKLCLPSDNFLIISAQCESSVKNICMNIKGRILVFYIKALNTVVARLIGTDELFIESRVLNSSAYQIIQSGDSICGLNTRPVYYSDIIALFSDSTKAGSISFAANRIEYKFPNGAQGLHSFSFKENSGTLIAIMGGSGAGKTTLMNILNGSVKPSSGALYINNLNIHEGSGKTEGAIGFIPQDDLLFEDLTVFQNLYYSAKLSFAGLDEIEIHNRVNKVLQQLELDNIKDLKVGNFLNKFISGGQRKRLNIALELIREPSILLVDEPTSGLSSADSEKVVLLLKEQANNGKIIIINIHQPSSFIFRMFDSLWILDKGGRIIYKGRPLDAITYFKKNAFYPQPDERECPECGALNPEIIFKIIEAKKLDGVGGYSAERKNSAEDWHNIFKQNFGESSEKFETAEQSEIEVSQKPSIFRQFAIFFERNFKVKSGNRQYMLTTLLQTPLLALIVSYFTKFVSSSGYNLELNKHLPFYLFMTVIVSLFSGMMSSAEEIIKDRTILKREQFLNLSWGSYLNSKIIFLFIVSAVQAFLYIIIGNSFLMIKGQFFLYWLVFFSASCTANMIGLNLSNALNSAAAIYIIIPLILIPQILLGGLIIEFDDMPFKMKKNNNVAFIGNVMTSRWAYEALAVGQYKYNDYQKYFFNIEKQITDNLYYGDLLIPELKRRIETAVKNDTLLSTADSNKIYYEVSRLLEKYPFFNNENTTDDLTGLMKKLESMRLEFKNRRSAYERKKDVLINELKVKLGNDGLEELRKKNSNDALSDLLKKSRNTEFYRETDERFVRLCLPVFKDAESNVGGAHFYAAEKNIAEYYFETPLFNIIILWAHTTLLYLLLYFNLIRKILYKGN